MMLLLFTSFLTEAMTSSNTSTSGNYSMVHTLSQASSGIITFVAGSNSDEGLIGVYDIAATAAKLDGAKGVVIGAAGNLFISTNTKILKLVASTGLITLIAGKGSSGSTLDGILATSADLKLPKGIALDKVGNIYVAE